MSLVPSFYSSDDVSAPVLTGQAGSFAALMDALLVDGYGSGGAAKAPLGWTRTYTASNKRVFRNNPVSGLGYYMRIDDTQTRAARVRMYLTMSTIDAGTGVSPTTAQRTNGALWVKSITTDSTARKWWAIGNERCFYIFIAGFADSDSGGIPALEAAAPYFAGPLVSHRPGDQFHYAVSPGQNTFAGATTDYWSFTLGSTSSASSWQGVSLDIGSSGVVVARGHAQTGNPLPLAVAQGRTGSSIWWGGNAAIPYPDPISGGLVLGRGFLLEGSLLARGYMPGLWVPEHGKPFADLHVESSLPGFPTGTQLLAKSFAPCPAYATSGYCGQVLFDITNAW